MSSKQRSIETRLAELRKEQRVHLDRLGNCREALAEMVGLLGASQVCVAPEQVRALPSVADNAVRAVIEAHRLEEEILGLERELASTAGAAKPAESHMG